jgi:hypothetical protein
MAGGELVFDMGDKPNTQWMTEPPVSQITSERITAVPVISAGSKTFKTEQEISIVGTTDSSTLYYTTDGTEPNRNSKQFDRPLTVNKTTTIKARAIGSNGQMSQVTNATFLKLPHSWDLTLNTKYSSQYSGGGDQALIDGIRGTTNFSSGAWQGYQGTDLIAVVDLGQTQSVSRLGAGFLQDVGSWILMPVDVDFDVSTDGVNFVQVLSIPNSVSNQNYETLIKDFTGTISPRMVRYVRMHARNFGKLPAWHAGAGGDAWIFADEILIE